jgi:hypothetical protein
LGCLTFFCLAGFDFPDQAGRMKPPLTFLAGLILVGLLDRSFAAQSSARIRTISDVPSLSHRVLQRSISPRFYGSLRISPIEGCVIVRAQLSNTHLSGMSIIHSELDGAYDSLALERAKAVTIAGYYAPGKMNRTGNVLVHLLIYKIADGTMALSFAQLDEPGGDQQEYYGSAVLAVRGSGGLWTEIKSVDTLQGKGLTLRESRFAMRDIWFFAGFQPGGK